MPGKMWQQQEAAGHMTSSIGKQREMDAGAQLPFSCRLQLSPQPMGWGCPCSGWLVPPQLNLFGNPLTDKPSGCDFQVTHSRV